MIDHALVQHFVDAHQARQDRQPSRVGRGVARRAERILVHVPDGFRIGMPLAVVGLAGAMHVEQFVRDVVRLVVDDQVPVAVVLVRRQRVALDRRAARNGHRQQIAFVGIGVDDDRHLGLRSRYHDIGNANIATFEHGAEVGMQRLRHADGLDQRGRIGRQRRGSDPLIPGIVGGKQDVSLQRHQCPLFECLEAPRAVERGVLRATRACRRERRSASNIRSAFSRAPP